MNNFKVRKSSPSPRVKEILLRMKNRFVNGANSDDEDCVKEEYKLETSPETCDIKEEFSLEISPDDEIAKLLQSNGHNEEELLDSIRSAKKMHENPHEEGSTNNSDQIEEAKPRIILTLRPNENKPDSYVSSSNLTNCAKRKKLPINDPSEAIIPKRSSRRSNDGNQSVLKSAIARKERTFSTDVDTKKILPKKIKKEPILVTSEENVISVGTRPIVEDKSVNIKSVSDIKQENIIDQKKKKKKLFKGGRYNIFKKKTSQKENKKTKQSICRQLNPASGYFEIDSSETNSEKHSVSVCSDAGTLMSNERSYQDDNSTNLNTSLSASTNSIVSVGVEGTVNDSANDMRDKYFSLCLCHESVQVVMLDEGKVTCKAEDCIDGKLVLCKNMAYHTEDYGSMPMMRANVTLPFLTFCESHIKRYLLHQSCPRCARFCSEGIFMVCKNKHFFHIGCYQKERGCLHCGISDVYDLEITRHIIKEEKILLKENTHNFSVQVGNVNLSSDDCPPEIDVKKLSKYLEELRDEIGNPNRTLYSVRGLYQACETNNMKKFLSIIGAECNLEFKFPEHHNRTALHAACYKGNLIIVHMLLQAGVDPNLVDDKMNSPMRLAAKFGHSVIVQYLMNRGGLSEIKNMQGMTSLHSAAKHGKLECCKVILNNRPSMVNWRDHGGWTPLVWACENGHVDVVRYFITHKPNTRVPDDDNNVAIHWAATSNCLKVVKCIVEYDSEVNMFNDAGDTALHIAARKNAADIVSYLLEKGAMAWHRNNEKKKPIECCFPGTKCYSLLKKVPHKQRKPVTVVQPFVPIIPKCDTSKDAKEPVQSPVFVKTTPVLVSEDITHGCEDVPIRCVNEIDDEIPIEFTYIKENCYDVGNYVDSAMSLIANCNCEGACNTNTCKCVQANGQCLYDENGRLNSEFNYFNPNVILYECNLRCKCHKQKCGNRVIQKGIKVELELFRHKDMGWGVRVLHDIPRGTFVCEYVGEIITDQKADGLKEDSYLFNLENPGATELYCIDAFCYSNVSRFINHSCDPNLMSVRSFINHHDTRFPRIAFFAVQDIKKNEQLCYNYGTAFWKIKGGLFTCKCGKDNCNFSDETIKYIYTGSDDEEPELNESTEISKLYSAQSDTNEIVINETNGSESEACEIKLSQNSNLSELKNKQPSVPVSKSSSMTVGALQRIHSKESVLKNGLLKKNKSIKVVITKEPNKNVSKQLPKVAERRSTNVLGSKSLHNNLKQVSLKKKVCDKMLNGNASTGKSKIGPATKYKSSVKRLKMKQIFGCNKVSSKPTIRPVNNKNAATACVLRPKMSSSKRKASENMKSEDKNSNNVLFKSSNLGNKKTVDTLSNASSSFQKTTTFLNELSDSDVSIDVVKIDPEINQTVSNGFSETSKMAGLSEKEDNMFIL